MAQLKVPRKILPSDLYVRPVLPALLVFLAFMVIIGISLQTARIDITTQRDAAITQESNFIESTLKQRFTVYENSLRAAKGLFTGSDNVTRNEWTEFVNTLDLNVRYPGIRGLGYAKIVPAIDKEAFQSDIRTNDLSTYTIYPEPNSELIAPIKYLVPLDSKDYTDRTAPAIGFDIYSDPARKNALIKAAASGEATLSGIVNLIKKVNERTDKGFYLILPIYKKDMPIRTPVERLAAIDGYFYEPFVTGSVFTNLFTVPNSSFAFTIYDGERDNAHFIYDSEQNFSSYDFKQAKTSSLTLYGENWTVVYRTKKEIVPYSVRQRPLSVLVGGSIFSASLALIIYLLIQRRTRSLAYGEQRKLEEAKDELLSLASHQLRTPATAVKQYVSMVKEGFAGELTYEQKKLLQMAYDSNERQLTIVDDLLYVARVDAGKANLSLETIDLNHLLTSVIDEQRSVIRKRSQKVKFKHTKKPVLVNVDPQYIRMIFENLLSNASKYSHVNTVIHIDLKINKNNVIASVTDKGVGINAVDHGSVFMKFSRIPNELTRQTQGSGIGLYLAKQLAVLHGGDLTFISSELEGSSFTLTLPRK